MACDCRRWRKTANEEQVIDLHSVGFDALTTDLPSLDAFAERYRHLKINLVFAVPDQFPRPDLFPHESNGVRYGQIRLFELYAYRKHDLPSEMAACVEELLEAVTLRKEHVAHARSSLAEGPIFASVQIRRLTLVCLPPKRTKRKDGPSRVPQERTEESTESNLV